MAETKQDHPGELAEQHTWAEEIAQRNALVLPDILPAQSSDEVQTMLFELRVHQLDLEMQNEELRRV